MRKIKITADSSANLLELNTVPFASAPLKVITAEKEFVDDATLDVNAMLDYFSNYKDKSKTSCPSPGDWLEAFGDADDIFCVAITSGLSGSYNSACIAKQMYEAEHEGAQKLKELIQTELPQVTVHIGENRSLCSYYAEVGGLLVGYEKR